MKNLIAAAPPVLVAPDADQQVHRDERDLEEHVEQDEILRREDPEHPELRDEQDGEVLLQVLPHVPRGHDGDERQKRREEEHPEPEPVEPDPVAYVERPIHVTSCVSAAAPRSLPEREVDVEREDQGHGGHPERGVAHQALVVRQEQHENGAEQRDEDGDGGDHRRDPTANAATVTTTIRPTTRNAYWAPTMTPMISTLSRINSA